MTYEEIPHTADVKIRARAETLPLLFNDLCDALMEIMYGPKRQSSLSREIVISSRDTETLLLDFLSEVLFISESEGIVFSGATLSLDSGDLHAILHGEPYDSKKHAGGTEVKGISYSGLMIRHDANGYMAEIVFDV